MKDNNCIFCKIIDKEIPAKILLENDNLIILQDIKPSAPFHHLIIPKKHIVWMQDANDDVVAEIFKLTKKIMLALKKGLGCDYVQVSVVGNEVPHFHVHLIPRYNSQVFPNLPTKEYKDEEAREVLNKITGAL